jgi:hypothetical protein
MYIYLTPHKQQVAQPELQPNSFYRAENAHTFTNKHIAFSITKGAW